MNILTFDIEDWYNCDFISNDFDWDKYEVRIHEGVDKILKEYSNKIINIHPALLPKYGGKGMYGMHVHSAVIEAGEKESGITIHYVNEHYDEGQIIFQAKCSIVSSDTPETLAQKIHSLEYEHFPVVIEKLIKQL